MRYVYLFAAMLTAVPVFGQGPADLSISNYRLVKEEIGATHADLEFRVDLVNRGPARVDLTGIVTSTVPSIQVIRGTLRFAAVPANGQITSSDTILVRSERSVPFSAANLVWNFPSPNAPVANAGPNQTVSLRDTVILNGSASISPSGGGPLAYSWAITSRPTGSAPVLTNPTSVNPSLKVDFQGYYVLQLTVTNSAGSSQAVVTISTINSPPTAHAGSNQSVNMGAVVQLHGSGSSDVDGDPLAYSWLLVSRPPSSSAALSSATGVNPSLTADKAGTYTAQLIVNDGKTNSAPSTVIISTQNTAPVAHPGSAQTVNIASTVQLNGAGSTDVDGDLLTYQWSFNSTPAGSTAALSSPTAVNPSFIADTPGTYVVQLIVDDGKVKSSAATVTVSTSAVQIPTANAGVNQTVRHGALVALSGTGSDTQSLPLTYLWSLTTRPADSTASLIAPTTANPSFTADRPGTYVAQLIVNNGFVGSAPATVTITTTNTAPVARPGANQNAVTGAIVSLNGAASSDADGDAITYSWTFTTKPAESPASLQAPTSATPTFVPFVAGTYVVQLIASDSFSASDPATVTIQVTNRGTVVLPVNLTVELGRSVPFPVTLSEPAPAGGVTISLSSSNTSRVSISPVSVFVAENATAPTTQPQITGTGLGPVSMSASSPAYNSGQSQARSTATLVLAPSSLTMDEGESRNVTLTLSAPAPAGGVPVTLSWSNPGVAGTPSIATIPHNSTSVTLPITGSAGGTTVLRASAQELSDATTSVIVNRRDILLPSGIVVTPGEVATFPVSLPAPAPQATFVTLTSSDPSKVSLSVQTLLFNQGQTQPTAQPRVIGNASGTVTITATAINLNPASVSVSAGLRLEFAPASLTLPGATTENLLLVLSGPAPQSGVLVSLNSTDPSCATVPQTVLIGAGLTMVSVPVTGVAAGSTVIRATAAGTGESAANVTVTHASSGSIVLPSASTIPHGQTAPLQLSLSQPAPAGGVTITLTSSDTGKVTVAPQTLTINAGQTQPTSQPQVTGAGVGSAAITAAAAGYASVSQSVQVNAIPTQIIVFSGTPQSATVNTAFAEPLIAVVRDASGNSIPGVTVSFNAPVFGAGATFANGGNVATTNAAGFAISGLPTANGTPGSYSATASIAGLSASFPLTNLAPVNNGQGSISITGATVGRNLEAPITLTLSQPAPSGGLRVELNSPDPLSVLLAGRPTDTGRARLTFTIGEGLTVVTGIYVHGLQSTGAVAITATAPGWNTGSANINLAPSGFVLAGPNEPDRQTLSIGQSASAALTLSAARLDASLNFVETQPLRGGYSATVNLGNSVPALGNLSRSSVVFEGGETSAQVTFTAGLTTGSTVLAASVPSEFSLPGQSASRVSATIVTASMTIAPVTVGANLQRAASIQLTSPAPAGGVPVTLSSNDPSRVFLSNHAAMAGGSSISFTIPEGRTSSQEFYIQGLANPGQATYTALASGLGTATGTVTVARSGFVLIGPTGIGADFSATSGGEATPLTIEAALLDSSLNFVERQQIRGGFTVDLAASSSDTGVGTLTGFPLRLNGGSASGSAQFHPGASAGSTVLTLATPAGFTAPAGGSAIRVTSTAPGIVITDGIMIGRNLQSIGRILIGRTAPAGGIAVTLTSSSPLVALATGESSTGFPSITVTIPAGQTSAAYYIQANAAVGTVTYTATAAGFAEKTATVRLATSAVIISGPFGFGYPLLTRLSGPRQLVSVSTVALDPVTNAIMNAQPLAGGTSIEVTLVNSNPSVGTVPSTVTINGGQSTVSSEFNPLTTGSTQILVQPVPGYSITTNATLSVTVSE